MTVALTLGVIFVNGWTDAPNAIATCVTTRCLPPKAAIIMSAIFNFLGVAFCNGQPSVENMVIPVWLMLLCSTVMGVGTSVGGEKIIKSVGMDMVKLEKYQGFSADLSSSLCLLLATLTGIPVSTTHVKTTAIMGVGAVKRLSAINFGVVKDMLLTWVFTFPGCGLISFLMAKLFLLFI